MKTVDLGVEWPRSIGGLSDLLHETRKSQTSKMRKIADQTEVCHGLKRPTLASSLETVRS